ncbi:hypothetical protein ACQ4M3_40600 [Leptolyngbya sp. AN03gr2]|uniref:hypothetical protein n=1 Tax=unclassified Leptolyngbya TaxID=2650499 RepID=UPI003D316A73
MLLAIIQPRGFLFSQLTPFIQKSKRQAIAVALQKVDRRQSLAIADAGIHSI